MKARHVLVANCRPLLLICALQLGGGALAGEGKEIIVTDDQHAPMQMIASEADAAMPPDGSTPRQPLYTGTRYRNGGHFGDENSDEKLENASR